MTYACYFNIIKFICIIINNKKFTKMTIKVLKNNKNI